MNRPAASTFLAAVTLASLVTPGNAAQIVEIRLRGHYFSAPATVVVNVATGHQPERQHDRGHAGRQCEAWSFHGIPPLMRPAPRSATMFLGAYPPGTAMKTPCFVAPPPGPGSPSE